MWEIHWVGLEKNGLVRANKTVSELEDKLIKKIQDRFCKVKC